MKEDAHAHAEDARLERWAAHRRAEAGDSAEFTRSVMDRILATGSEPDAPDVQRPAPKFQRVAMTAVCAAAGIGKMLIIIRLAI